MSALTLGTNLSLNTYRPIYNRIKTPVSFEKRTKNLESSIPIKDHTSIAEENASTEYAVIAAQQPNW